jgi:hypothetical protein
MLAAEQRFAQQGTFFEKYFSHQGGSRKGTNTRLISFSFEGPYRQNIFAALI